MSELRVNIGGLDWHVDMTVESFEELYKSSPEFMRVPLLLDKRPHSIIRIRPSQIKYYFEVL